MSPRGTPASSADVYSTKRKKPTLWAARYWRLRPALCPGVLPMSGVSSVSKETVEPDESSRNTPTPLDSCSRTVNPESGSAPMASPIAVDAAVWGDRWTRRPKRSRSTREMRGSWEPPPTT